MNRTRRALVITTTTALVASLLAGCTPASELAVKLENGVLLIAACDDIAASKVGAWVNLASEPELVTIWEATGSHRFSRGDLVRYGETPPGMTDETEPALLLTEGRFGVYLVGEPTSLRGAFDIEELDDSRWHAADGSVRDDAC